jgi:hypothetical protein
MTAFHGRVAPKGRGRIEGASERVSNGVGAWVIGRTRACDRSATMVMRHDGVEW